MMILFIIFIPVMLATPFGVSADNCTDYGTAYCSTKEKCDQTAKENPNAVITQKPTADCKGGEICCVLVSESATPAAPTAAPAEEKPAAAPAGGSVPILSNPYHFPDPLGGTNVSEIVKSLINSVLLLVGGLFFVMFLWGGVTWMISEGDKTKVEKATKTLKNAVIGIAIVATSYILVTNIIKILSS